FIIVNAVTRPWATKARLTSSDSKHYLLNVSVLSGEDQDPASVSQADMKLFRETMETVVKDVLLDRKEGLIKAELIEYDEFLSRLDGLKAEN
ncbi:MAG: hypothetical protein DRP45_05585, partial [Candidatus Zixiibacteriota bacterium]